MRETALRLRGQPDMRAEREPHRSALLFSIFLCIVRRLLFTLCRATEYARTMRGGFGG